MIIPEGCDAFILDMSAFMNLMQSSTPASTAFSFAASMAILSMSIATMSSFDVLSIKA